MIEEPQLITKESSRRYGGLLICGTNFRDDPPRPEKRFEPYADYFTHTPNSFVDHLTMWFDWWGLPLKTENGTPTELNHSISATNLFYDTSPEFVIRQPSDMDQAFDRLLSIVNRLDISGVLIASEKLVDGARQGLALLETEPFHSGKFWVNLASGGTLEVALCPDPTVPQSRQDVEGCGEAMRNWIWYVLNAQRRKRIDAGEPP